MGRRPAIGPKACPPDHRRPDRQAWGIAISKGQGHSYLLAFTTSLHVSKHVGYFRLFTSEFVSLMAIFCMAVLLAVKGSPQGGRANLQDGVSGYAQARPVARVRSFSMG